VCVFVVIYYRSVKQCTFLILVGTSMIDMLLFWEQRREGGGKKYKPCLHFLKVDKVFKFHLTFPIDPKKIEKTILTLYCLKRYSSCSFR
jgi:hypothetical protein